MERPIHLICSFVNAYFNDSFRIHNKWKWVYGENEELGQGSDTNLPGGSIRPPEYFSILRMVGYPGGGFHTGHKPNLGVKIATNVTKKKSCGKGYQE